LPSIHPSSPNINIALTTYYTRKTYVGFAAGAPLSVSAKAKGGSEPEGDFLARSCYTFGSRGNHACKNRSFLEDGYMIMRIFQVITKQGKEEEFAKFFHETAIPLMKGTKGIVQVLPGAPRSDSPREFSFVMIWDSLDSLKDFVGEDYQSPHIDPSEAELVEFRTIKHYDLVD